LLKLFIDPFQLSFGLFKLGAFENLPFPMTPGDGKLVGMGNIEDVEALSRERR